MAFYMRRKAASISNETVEPGRNAPKWQVHFAGYQRVKWAWDEDLRWAEAALDGRVMSRAAWNSRIIHAVWWPSAWVLGARLLSRRRVVCFADNPASYYARHPLFHAVARHVDMWIARSTAVAGEFEALGLPVVRAPYCADRSVFRPLPDRASIRRSWREKLNIPADAFVIANFNRDSEWTAVGPRPKRQKAPEIFLRMVEQVAAKHPHIIVLLAGPRRHWLRKELEHRGVPFRFVGDPVSADDYKTNVLDRATLNELYHASDLYLLTSRWEGGPHAVLEASLAGLPVLSTPVGMAADLLKSDCLFDSVEEGVRKLDAFVRNGFPSGLDENTRLRAERNHSMEKLRESLLEAYAAIPCEPPFGVKGLLEAAVDKFTPKNPAPLRPVCYGGGVERPLDGRLAGLLEHPGTTDWRVMDLETFATAPASAKIRVLVLERGDICDRPETVRKALTTQPDGTLVPDFECIREAAGTGLRLPTPLVLPVAKEWDGSSDSDSITRQTALADEDCVANVRDYFRMLERPDAMPWEGLR